MSTQLPAVQGAAEALPAKLSGASTIGSSGLKLTTLGEVQQLAGVLFQSGWFEDVKSAAQATIKILYGLEQGLSPMESMNGLYVYKGKICAYADLIGTKIKQSGRYDWRIVSLNDKGCKLSWHEFSLTEQGWLFLGETEFTRVDAEKRGLMQRHQYQTMFEDMCFARALTRGYKRYAQGVFKIPINSVEEMREEDLLEVTDKDKKALNVLAGAGKKTKADPKPVLRNPLLDLDSGSPVAGVKGDTQPTGDQESSPEKTSATPGAYRVPHVQVVEPPEPVVVTPLKEPPLEVGDGNPACNDKDMQELILAGKANGWTPNQVNAFLLKKFKLPMDKTFKEKFSRGMCEIAKRHVSVNAPEKGA